MIHRASKELTSLKRMVVFMNLNTDNAEVEPLLHAVRGEMWLEKLVSYRRYGIQKRHGFFQRIHTLSELASYGLYGC